MAKLADCWKGCLDVAGRAGIAKDNAVRADNGKPDNAIQAARHRKTNEFYDDRHGFMLQLKDEVIAFKRKAERIGLKPCIRLNGTSDIRFENIPLCGFANIFEMFSEVQFYDYTKIPNRKNIPENYHLSISYSEASKKYAAVSRSAAIRQSRSLVVVVRDDQQKTDLIQNGLAGMYSRTVVDGDLHDLRFLDPVGAVVVLKAKGKAKKDQGGFVIDYTSDKAIAA